jgi:hypothetical protein
MTALIIALAGGWRMRNRPQRLPAAIDVALDHILWLRMADPQLTPDAAGRLIGSYACYNWAQVVQAYAAAWEALPEGIRRKAREQ